MKKRISSLRSLSSLRSRGVLVERLEDRRCFNVDFSLGADGQSLYITGDEASNQVAIEETADGIQVRDDDQPSRSFSGIQNIYFDGRDGADTLSVHWGMRHGLNLQARMGNGDDKFLAEVDNLSDGALPPGPCRIFVSEGAGNDQISALIGLLRNERTIETGQVDFSFETGDGNDSVDTTWGSQVGLIVLGRLGAGDDSLHSVVFGGGGGSGFGDGGGAGLPPGPCRMTIFGDSGNDLISGLIGQSDSQTPTSDISSPITQRFDGGDGVDTINTTLRNVRLSGPVSVDLQGGGDNDTLIGLLDKVIESNAFSFNCDGGVGDDILNLLVPRSSDGVVPETNLDVLGRSQIRLEGGDGFDRIIGQLTPHVAPSGNLEVTFSGGIGSDIITMLLTPQGTEVDQGGLAALVLGGDGNDRLALIVKNQDAQLPNRRYLLDGGLGFDYYLAAPFVSLISVEKKL